MAPNNWKTSQFSDKKRGSDLSSTCISTAFSLSLDIHSSTIMASMAINAASSYMGCSATVAAKQPSTSVRRGMVVVRASSEKMLKEESKAKSDGGRRDLMFGVTAAAALALCSAAVAEEPKRGSPEAKKKYGPVCVTMPTARICHNIK
ncbi:hypothetical protein ACS0TY_026851 [Phlomoides rotata]